ncbi:hypothetical protein RF11_13742 [Thelohanellus kitauei]|uniref:SET domain-containing protein n=1 Tax=Thelohanellus kitauei TaxID=669202 RepID=A0A0C2MSU1_THEKT|nr:hypothetical protein RF11_13742 [Thelohanellus kitauei]
MNGSQEKDDIECICHSKIFQLLKSQAYSDADKFEEHKKNKNCQTFTLKTGQKVFLGIIQILKCAKLISDDKFVCEMKGELHIFNDCSYIQSNYNAYSSFIYNFNLFGQTLTLDARTSTHISRYIRRSCQPNCRILCSNFDEASKVRVFLCSNQSINNLEEITIGVDRNEYLFQNSKSGSRHHWQRYDYSSSMVCVCNSDKTNHPDLCSVRSIRNIIRSYKNQKSKNSPAVIDDVQIYVK